MTFNCVKTGMEEESLNIVNINLLVRFNKTREIFPRALSNLSATTAISTSVERVDSKKRVPKVPCSIPAASYG